MNQPKLSDDLQKILDARHSDPFVVLGRHEKNDEVVVRALLPYAEDVTLDEGGHRLERIYDTSLFEWRGSADQLPSRYRLIWRDHEQHEYATHDPRIRIKGSEPF